MEKQLQGDPRSELRQSYTRLCAELGQIMFVKRDLEMNLSAANKQIDILVKQRDELNAQMKALDESASNNSIG